MIHGNVPADFKKLVNQSACPHSDDILLRIVDIMGPADEPNPLIPAGWTYFGQFVDHDLTFSRETGMNARTPVFDLDSLYGKGPSSQEHCHLFEGASGSETFKIGNQTNPNGDLIRGSDFVAQIPDPRNDENIIIASLQLLFQKFHNFLVTQLGFNFSVAKRTVTWHYQSIVKSDFLPRIVGKAKVKDIVKHGRRIFTPSQGCDVFMPMEYSGACYRFGHSMVREKYSFNASFRNTQSNPNLFYGFPGGRPVTGGHQITEIWTLQGNGNSLLRFFDPSNLDPSLDADNMSGKIDTKLSSILFNLEVEPGQNNVLAHRNLLSGQRLQLANGQQVAAALQYLGITVNPLKESEILQGGAPTEIGQNTPLWYYVLREAEIQHAGAHLGQVGGTIVAETIIGLLESDTGSLLHRNDDWPHKLGDKNSDAVSIIDLIEFISTLPDVHSA